MTETEKFTPQNFRNPYPDEVVRVGCVKYVSDLHICRKKSAFKRGDSDKDPEYIVCKDYKIKYSVVETNNPPKWYCILVPAGTLTDLSSAPFAFRCFVERVGRHLEASIVHDFLYIAWQHICGRGAQAQDRKFADDIFLAAMRAARVPYCRRNAMYMATRSYFGRRVYEEPNSVNFADMQLIDERSNCDAAAERSECECCDTERQDGVKDAGEPDVQ